MKKILLYLTILLISSCKILINNTRYDYLTPIERRLIDTFDIKNIYDSVDYSKFRIYKNHNHDTLKIQEVKFSDVEKIFPLFDTTIFFFAKPWCGGYETLLSGAINYCKKDSNINVKRKLVILNDSYEFALIQDALKSLNFTERVYIIDKSYGKTIYKNLKKFKKTHFGYNRKQSVNSTFIFFDKNGKIVNVKMEL